MSKLPALRSTITRGIVDIGIFSFVMNILLLVMPLYMLQVYDRVLPSSSYETLLFLSMIAVLSLVSLGLLEIVRSIYSYRIAASMDVGFGRLAFEASLSGLRADAGDIQPLRDLGTVRSFVASRGMTALFDLPFAPLFIALLYFIHPYLFWLTIAGMALMFLIVLLNQLANKNIGALAADRSAAANYSAQAFARNSETLRAMGMLSNVTEAWGARFAESVELQGRASFLSSIFGSVSRFLRMVLQLAILAMGAWLVLAGEMTGGMIFASSIISGRALQPIDQLIGGWRQFTDAIRSWRRLQAIVNGTHTKGEKIKLPAPAGMIEAKDLTYVFPSARPGTEPIIQRISFKIDSGEAIAIVGPSRAGKSTLAKLLVGAIEPTAGSIKFDGADLRTWDEAQLGRNIGYLSQDVQLLPGRITDNLSRFDLEVSDQKVIAAAQRAMAHELILSQPYGYQTQIGTSGISLSGGERQRIGLARAFYGAPKVLVLDEPNANLDSEGDAALERALADAKASKTTVILITHRLSIAAKCDRVMVLGRGAIEAFGPSMETLQKHTVGRPVPTPRPRQPLTASLGLPIRSNGRS